MKKYLTLGFNFAIGIAVISLGLGEFYMSVQYGPTAFGAYSNPSSPVNTSSNNQSSMSTGPMNGNNNNSIVLSVSEISGVYKWINGSSNAENPELNLKANSNHTIQIQNPTDTKHELIIESQGKEIATSGDIAPSSSGQLSFRPNSTGTYGYHCEYHPETMKGTITVSS